MTLVNYDPWQRLMQLHREMDTVMNPRASAGNDTTNAATADWIPAVDIKEEETRYVVMADIPGVDPTEIEIHMDNGLLTLRGERKSENVEEKSGYKRVERSRGSFYRRFSLPDTADVDNISAKGLNGVLEITIPKQEKALPRRIQVEG